VYAIRGYYLQVLIAILESLDEKEKWTELSIEPPDESEKVDIKFFYSQKNECRLLQVKSSKNQINVPHIKKWIASIKKTTDADNIELILLGPCSAGVVKYENKELDGIKIHLPKIINENALLEQAAHRLNKFFEIEKRNIVYPTDSEFIIRILITGFFNDIFRQEKISRNKFKEKLFEYAEKITKTKKKERSLIIPHKRRRILENGIPFSFDIQNIDHMKRKFSVKDKGLINLLKRSPAIELTKTYSKRIDMKVKYHRTKDIETKSVKFLPFTINKCLLNTSGKIEFQGELQNIIHLEELFGKPITSNASIDLTSIAYIIIDCLLFSYRIYRYSDFSGLISARFHVPKVEQECSFEISFFSKMNHNFFYENIIQEGLSQIYSQIQRKINESVYSVLEICDSLLKDISLNFGYRKPKLIEELLINYILHQINDYEIVYPFSGSYFNEVNLKLNYSPLIEDQRLLFLKTGEYVHSNDIESIKSLYKKKLLNKFETDKEGRIERISIGQTTDFPLVICELAELRELQISGNIKSLPAQIGELKRLEKLILPFNDLKTLPDNIKELKNLRVLGLYRNLIEELPFHLKELNQLERIDLCNNKIEWIPDWIGDFQHLEDLSLCNNNLHTLPESIKKLINLKNLSLSGNSFRELPDNLFNLTNLEQLTISNINMNQKIKPISRMTNLTVLELTNCKLNSLPDDFGEQMSQLRQLNLTDNPLDLKKTEEQLRKLGFKKVDNLFFHR